MNWDDLAREARAAHPHRGLQYGDDKSALGIAATTLASVYLAMENGEYIDATAEMHALQRCQTLALIAIAEEIRALRSRLS